ncbi:UPF0158 family protein [Chryseobacterium gotjawalense]|uniref:UPF0158 family protein n=1 Tax=Chryseobacterium gotjawalense TaxID=3042315 RepID=A0ABY8RBE8_9FLAO|nr:UPF0158 family protein [Chryseobacterium sp. wdc7]WHF51298.1 UPF0158 family protein [Chryseobacterium sp. wdc7]
MENSMLKAIAEIAQELDCGNDCYYHPTSHEIISIPNFSNFFDEEGFQECFKDELQAVEKNRPDFIKIEVVESTESFKIMKLFVDQLNDTRYQAELESILENKKPFQNFKNSIDNSDFREEWFAFKKLQLEKIVAMQLNEAKGIVK